MFNFGENWLGGWGSTVLIGLGVAVAVPILLPIAGAVVRPVAKGLVKGSLLVADSIREFAAEGSEQVSDLIAEARAEYYGASSGSEREGLL